MEKSAKNHTNKVVQHGAAIAVVAVAYYFGSQWIFPDEKMNTRDEVGSTHDASAMTLATQIRNPGFFLNRYVPMRTAARNNEALGGNFDMYPTVRFYSDKIIFELTDEESTQRDGLLIISGGTENEYPIEWVNELCFMGKLVYGRGGVGSARDTHDSYNSITEAYNAGRTGVGQVEYSGCVANESRVNFDTFYRFVIYGSELNEFPVDAVPCYSYDQFGGCQLGRTNHSKVALIVRE